MSAITAAYFNGHSSRRHDVVVDVRDGIAYLSGDGVARSAPLATLEISDAIGAASRIVRFPDGAYCEVTDAAAFGRLLAAQAVKPSVVSQWEGSRSWTTLVLTIVGLALVLVLAYRYATPLVARAVARRLPPVVAEQLSAATLEAFDAQFFEPSTLPASRQALLAAAFDRLRLPGRATGLQYRLLFRDSAQLGPNAIALPSGTIVMTDQLVALAVDDRELLGVLAHEAGHVDHRHGLQSIVQGSLVAWLVAWFVGDASSLLAVAPTVLLQAKYSRDLEEEADTYAADVLRANGIAITHLVSILERMEQAKTATPRQIEVPTYLSTHPATRDRLYRLRSQ